MYLKYCQLELKDLKEKKLRLKELKEISGAMPENSCLASFASWLSNSRAV